MVFEVSSNSLPQVQITLSETSYNMYEGPLLFTGIITISTMSDSTPPQACCGRF